MEILDRVTSFQYKRESASFLAKFGLEILVRNARPIVIGFLVLLVECTFPARGLVPLAAAAAKDLSEADIYKMESDSKDFVIDLIAAGVWTKNSDQYKQFNKYAPKARLKLPEFNKETEEFEKTFYLLTGAEYRHAFASAKAFGSYNKLDVDAQKRLNMEFFGQEIRPEIGTDKYTAGLDKAKSLLHIILGEAILL